MASSIRPARPGQIDRASQPDRTKIRRSIRAWFARTARDLPWRTHPAGSRPPYLVLVSELMLQQTQVSRVLEILPRFLKRFPSMESLAQAQESEVLSAWTGLGYYRRARHLQAAAQAIVRDHDGSLPSDPRAIRALPGVGEYTTGSLASLCFDLPIPAVDTNVQRVLQRLYVFDADPKSPKTNAWARQQATELLTPARSQSKKKAPIAIPDPVPGSGILNEALIELGALICTPRAPKCDQCPLRTNCLARARNLTDAIPRATTPNRRTPVYCAVVVIQDRRGRVLIEQRPESGLWAGMHQAPTLERTDRPPRPKEIKASVPIAVLREQSRFDFQTTHRDLTFVVYQAEHRPGARVAVSGRQWVAPNQFPELALSSPQRRILANAATRA